MTLTQTHAEFSETSYTLIGALRDERTADQATADLTRIYWPAVYAFLRRRGMNRDEAAELTQGFFVDKVFGNRFFEKADTTKGTLRGYIRAAISNYAIDTHRAAKARGKGSLIPLESIYAEQSPPDTDDPHTAFDQRWAAAQLEEAMHRCEAHFRANDKPAHWEAFADRIHHPSVRGTLPTPLNDLAPRLGFSAPANAAAAVQQVRRRAVSFLQEVVAESADPGQQPESEYAEIVGILQP